MRCVCDESGTQLLLVLEIVEYIVIDVVLVILRYYIQLLFFLIGPLFELLPFWINVRETWVWTGNDGDDLTTLSFCDSSGTIIEVDILE